MIRKTSSNPKKLTAIKQKSPINPSIPSHQPVDSERTLFPVVGIGVLATELRSLRQFFTRMPADSGAAFVVIQQSDAMQENLSPQQLQDVTSMKIVHVENLMEVQPDCIYIVAQSNKNVFISKGFLCLFDAEPGHASNSLIDFFFYSLAEEYRESAVGVIFSGSGANGTQGLRAIRKKGGLALTQDSMFNESDGMRDCAIEASTVDTLVAPDVLPDIVTSHLKSKSQGFHLTGAMSEVVQLLSRRMGNDFSQYKRSTLYRRVDRRMQQNQISKVEDYVHFLNENPIELDLLFKELLINVTHFFRDPVMWQYVKAEIIPPILAAHPEGKTVRIWVPACSTGEEAYGFAILFREALEQRGVQDRYLVKIFATDLDQDAITKARQGFYPIAISQYISLERLNRFFVKHENGYRVCNEIRQMVIFAPQNLIADVPFSKLDILSCRNLLIYLDRELQKRLFPLFYYALNPGGILLLGTAESIDFFRRCLLRWNAVWQCTNVLIMDCRKKGAI